MLNTDPSAASEDFLLSPAFVSAITYDDGAAAKEHLAAGRPIYYGDDAFPGEVIKEYPDGRRQIVVMNADDTITVVRDL
ncbi:hypothetical protein GALL_375210 [mine drainage metagenome]|uniref:Uncharacterized protein n=1 Tax=mine drainage metagenome TaxID=410659 RepID=A0A1J5QL83_9ZZZZ